MEGFVLKVAQNQKWGELDMSEKENFELDRNQDPTSYSTGMNLDWRFGGYNPPNSSVGLVSMGNSINVNRGDLIGSSSCSSASMVDSFGPNFWDHPPNSQNMGFCDINVHNNGSSSNRIGIRRDGHDHRAAFEMGWDTPHPMLKGDGFIPNGPGMFPRSLSQFPTDSGFIERAARYSCFGGGNFGEMVNSYVVPQSVGLYAATGGGTMHGTRNALVGNGLKSAPGGQSQENNLNVVEAAKDLSPSVEQHLATKGSPLKNDKKCEIPGICQDEGKQALVTPADESDRAESSDDGGGGGGNADDDGDGQDDSPMFEGTSGEPSIKGQNSKKRKRSGKDADDDEGNGAPKLLGEGAKDNPESPEKGDQQPTSTTKASGKNAKQGSQASDPPKEEYIHVRARRGQATNSHSLAERVRREKISERMKFLQDLVPGCSKVTGKAVMLDEIINYVQSLQRQVEFLSMKLATVNPRLDFNVEALFAKDILHQRPGLSSVLGFPLEMSMAYPQLHPSQPGIIHPTLPSMGNTSDILRRTIHSHSPTSDILRRTMMPDGWEDELHNVVQMNFAPMSFAPSAPLNSEDVDGNVAANQMKVEL